MNLQDLQLHLKHFNRELIKFFFRERVRGEIEIQKHEKLKFENVESRRRRDKLERFIQPHEHVKAQRRIRSTSGRVLKQRNGIDGFER